MATLLIVIIVLALIFDFINGFHDAANSIATVVSTKVLTPLQAVLWAALFNFVAFFIFKDHGVANSIAKTVKPEFITLPVILSGLIGAVIWNLLTWWYGIPSSSSHTLIGGFAGAAIAHAGFHSIDPEPVVKTVSFIVLAPLVGMIMAFLITTWFLNSFRRGFLPKLISIAIMALVSWLVVSNFQLHPEASKIKAEEKKVKFSGVELNAVNVTVADEDRSKIIEKWKAQLGDPNATVSGDSLVTAQTTMADVSENPVTVYTKFSSGGELKTKMAVAFVKDSIALAKTKTADSTKYNAAAKMVSDFAVKTTNEAPVHAMPMLLAKENFKWFLLWTILMIMGVFTLWLSNLNNASATKWFKRLQLVSSAAFSIGHGGNDAQKVMGIITAALIAGGSIHKFEEMPVWVPLACYTAISLGTLSGGWKIIKTMGTRITKVTPFEGVAAETAGAITLFLTENLKIPVSTTHTITGSIIGVGATKRLSAVRWGVTVNLLWAWILTIPVTGILSALIFYITTLFS